jgi:hypothetical protein
MKQANYMILVILMISLRIATMHAQECLSISGGNAYGESGSACFTVGQVFYTSNLAANGQVSQGVQQGYEIEVISAVENIGDIILECTVFPNPTTDYLRLTINAAVLQYAQSCSYQLCDINGKIIAFETVSESETFIQMSTLLSGIYFIKVIAVNKNIKTFKIIKN